MQPFGHAAADICFPEAEPKIRGLRCLRPPSLGTKTGISHIRPTADATATDSCTDSLCLPICVVKPSGIEVGSQGFPAGFTYQVPPNLVIDSELIYTWRRHFLVGFAARLSWSYGKCGLTHR